MLTLFRAIQRGEQTRRYTYILDVKPSLIPTLFFRGWYQKKRGIVLKKTAYKGEVKGCYNQFLWGKFEGGEEILRI